MARRHPCPMCRREMLLEKVHEGFEVPCPACGHRFLVPAGATDAPTTPPGANAYGDLPPPRRPDGITPAADNEGMSAMIVGIVAMVLSCHVLGPVAWYMGHRDRQTAIRAGREPPGYATAGWVLGIVSSCILLLAGCGAALMIAAMAAGR